MDKVKLAEEIKQGQWNSLLSKSALNQIEQMPPSEIKQALDEITAVPINYRREISGELFRLYYTACWVKVMENIDSKNSPLKVLEIASGSSDPVPQALEIFGRGKGRYTTANLNKDLTRGMKKKTQDLNIEIEIIEDNAVNLENYFNPGVFDLTAFQHAVNDMIQTIIAQKKDIDTVNNDWYDILPDMVEAVTSHHQQGILEETAYAEFIEQIRVCCNLTQKGGLLAFNTHVFQMDLDSGYPLQFYKNYIQLARSWISKSELKLQEITYENFEPQWWLFYKKI